MASSDKGSGKNRSADAGTKSSATEREAATDMEGLEVDVSPGELLAALARLDLESALAYEAAAALSEDDALSQQLTAFAQDHRRHVQKLNPVLADEDEAQVSEGSIGVPLLAGLQKLAGPLGPEVVVSSLIANEQLTNLSYEGALAYEWDDELEALLQECRADEERHFAWLSRKHESLSEGLEAPGHPDA